ncbi:EF-hand domain-containing protein [Gimesia aquarii]|uniref:EF hand n=1 Tax=Gimesia aquarii TaxID=2527964 RepID=A0A517VU42_9PLAN|nr:EF-hand domain-containing protein [Gimesia aquarii]QDT96524.1 EF hand [Gimesia aquarii]
MFNKKKSSSIICRYFFYRWIFVLYFVCFGLPSLEADTSKQKLETKKENTEGSPRSKPPISLEGLKAAFRSRDIDQDGRVTEAEFVASFPKEKQPEAKRNFRLFNRDGDDVLSFAEYRSIAGLIPVALREGLPHPLQSQLEEQLTVLKKQWLEWDTDRNDHLSPEEFKAAKIHERITGLPEVDLKEWDCDADGKVSLEDCRRVLEAAYGLRRLDGQPLYLPSGQVVYWWHFKNLDQDHNDQLTLDEFLKYYRQYGEEQGKKRFTDGDTDQNQLISLPEWAAMPGLLLDPISEFQALDRNLDAFVDQNELMEHTAKWLQPLTRYTFPGFDLDRDGKLTLDEYRMTMPANKLENWAVTSRDSDFDGRLSLNELSWTSGLELSLLRQEYFRRLDTNQSGFLELNEYQFSIDSSRVPKEIVLEITFSTKDSDKDGRISKAEYVSSFPKEKQPEAKRDFLLFNRDGDDHLSLAEYRTIPGQVPVALREGLPHPLQPQLEQQLAVLKKQWPEWDSDRNDHLSPEEFKAAKIHERITGLPEADLKEWDRDADGKVSLEDCRRVLEAAYGIRRLDGQPLYLPSGQVVYWWHFKDLDRDRNNQLTLKEFQAYYNRFGEEEAVKRFQKGDTDQGRTISVKEWAAMPGHLLDPIAEFRKMDVNLDASLDEAELMEGIAPFLRPLAQFTFPGFDLDQDGRLSLDEYRLTLVANRIENWDVTSRDTDHDGRLSLQEMAWIPGLELSLLRQDYFRQLDQNQNGYLELDEFKVSIDGGKVPGEVALKAGFYSRDANRDRKVTEAEFVASFPKEKQPEAKRNFRLFNRDGDDVLSFAEYRSIAGLIPVALREGLPHPLQSQLEEQLTVLKKQWLEWDTDRNDHLSPEEFKAAKIHERITGLPEVDLKEWDCDADGKVSLEDCRRVLEAAYGLRRLDGQPLYLPSGQVVYWWHFKNLDQDHNDQLTLDEFLKYYRQYGEEQGKKRFTDGDTDQNQLISLPEWAAMPGLLLDPISEFQALDRNLDAFVDQNELMEHTAKWLQPLTRYTFPGFDLDRDGKLTLDEYRMTMPANKLENWAVTSRDSDFDGRLSLNELSWTSGLELSLLRQEYFRRLDTNQSGFLELNEYQFSIDSSRVPKEIVLEITFSTKDSDKDGRISKAEYVSSFPKEKQPEAKRDFLLFNRDGDDHLSLAEYRTIPGQVPVALREGLPHPLQPQLEQQLAVLKKQWPEWDSDRNDHLSPEEFKAAKIHERITGLPEADLKEWDRDADGKVSLEDCRRVLEAAYGIRRLDGQPLYLPSGQVVYWWHFKDLDRDRNNQLTLKEFQAYYNRFGEEEAVKRFQKGDTDQGRTISVKEWAAMPGHLLDPIAEFRKMDVNLDASLDEAELMEGIAPFLRPLAQFTFPGFDLDQDGRLSLDEYRLTLVANRIENWDVTSRDTDHDGRLSLQEMAWIPGLELSLLRQDYFRQLDQNQNGYLELDEFKVSIDGGKVPGEVALKAGFYSRDANRDRKVTEAEFVASLPKEKQPEAKRNFRLFNRDGDDVLSFAEYRSIAGLIPVTLREGLPHPLQPQLEQQLAVLKKQWLEWDTDRNDHLSPEEFKAAKIHERITGLPEADLKEWDRDADGKVSLEDCRRVLEAAYGLRRLDGQPLYLPSGQIVYWWHFKDLDRDRNNQLTLKEFQAYYNRFGEEEAVKRFQKGDTDQGGTISVKEWAAMPGNLIDTVADFQKMDTDLDGKVNQKELMEGVMTFLRPLARFTFPGFDINQDGFLSLDEYRLTLPVNRIENWSTLSRDRDHDGRLSLQEMAWIPGMELSLLRQEYFQRLDVNKDGFLDLDEFNFILDSTKVPAKVALKFGFKIQDTNHDGYVNETEFLSSFPKEKQPEAKRDFQLFNRNGDKYLSFDEYRTIAGLVPVSLRSELSHPLTVLVEEQLAVLKKQWPEWDSDRNDHLSPEEFKAVKIHERITGLPEADLKEWDCDADGKISLEDCRRVLEAAYGIRRLDGQPLHLPSGQVVYWWHFKALDRDHDDELTLQEFMAYYQRLGDEAGKKRFVEGDQDQNAKINLTEWAAMPGHLLDPIAEFRKMDVNLDASLDEAELMEGIAPFLRPLAQFTFPGFDLDQDGRLSLDEYRLTLVANRIENWDVTSRDTDHDGRLSLQEMAWIPGLELSLLRQDYFRQLDQNQNGYLELDEFKVSIDGGKVPGEVALKAGFYSRDANRDRKVTEAEFVASFPKEKQPEAKRNFRLFNRDGDDVLSFAEYRSIAGLIPVALREGLPHPLQSQLEEQLTVLKKQWLEWDTDRNDHLSPEEFKAAKIHERITGLPEVDLKEWDCDADGKVSLEDCRRVLEAAYGLRRLDGQPLYLPSGQVVYWWHFKNLDQDHNDQLTLDEFLKYYRQYGEEQGKKRFTDGDTDQNQLISLPEWAAMPGLLLDPISEFQALDRNLDAFVDQNELMEHTAKWLQPLTRYTFPGFDLDRDGKLTLDEYRMTMPANKLENWAVTSRDSDFDGRLSLNELSWTSGLELSLLRQEYFRRLDTNQSGFLELNEYQFSIDSSRVPKEIVLEITFSTKDSDKDGRISKAEYVSSFPKEKQPEAKRDFLLFNRDGDDHLSLAEYRTIPGQVPVALRSELPHPLTSMIKKQMNRIEKNWGQWDQDGDDVLSPKEYESTTLKTYIPSIAPLDLNDWDRDTDGKINREDCLRVIEAAYGMRRLDGQVLQLPTGLVVYWWHFKDLDRDHDDYLTLKEFQTYYNRFGEEEAVKRFQKGDTDQGGTISVKEWAAMPGFLLNPISEFRKLDTSYDGMVTRKELTEGVAPFLKPLAETVFPGFDLNQDGVLSLDEYRMTPVANRVENWMVRARDQNNDGKLSLSELPWTPGLELSLLRKEYFDRLDGNRDGFLDLNEYQFSIDFNNTPPEVVLQNGFRKRDTDQDGSLSQSEYISAFPTEKKPEAKRDFQLFDRDADHRLSVDEYAAIPGMAPSTLRGSLTNPLNELVDRQMKIINKKWGKWDSDQDGTLSQKEYQVAKIGRQIPGLALSSWEDWDRDEDGKISKNDCRWLFEAGYGIRRLDGQPLHLPSGQVVYWWHFKALDRDHDDELTLKEFMAYYQRLGDEAGKKRFIEGDQDQNAKINLTEWAAMPGHLLDPIAEFRKMDVNLDASLDEAELMEGIAPFLRPLASYTFPGFDLNQDRVLSLDEYRTSLPANRVENWISYSRDTDKDGRLSLTELGWVSGLELNLLRQEYFDRLDVNSSGYLEFNEFKFTVDLSKVPKELFFKHCDENQDALLSLDEFLKTEKNSGKIKLDGSQEPRVMRIEEAFYRADLNGDKLISLAELDTPEGHQIIAPDMSFKTGNRSSLQVSNQKDTTEDDSNMMMVVLGLNILLVLGVVLFLFRSHFKKT